MVHTGPHIGQNLHVVRGHGDRKRVVETLRDAYLHRPGLRSGRRHRDTERRCLPQDFEGEQVVAQPDAWDNRKRADISYQLLVYSFADGNGDKVGDLPGLTRRLDYIDALGASAVWLSPIHPAASYHGYDVLDYEAVNPAFGTDADLRAFIDAAHARGIRVYLDYVLNHTGKDHPWFKSAAASEGEPLP